MTVFTSPYAPVAETTATSLTEFVLQDVAQYGDADSLVDFASGTTYKFSDLPGAFAKCSAGFQKQGIKQGDVVCIYSHNVAEYAIAFHGLISLGITITTANPLYTVEELKHQLENSKAMAILASQPFLGKAKEAGAALGISKYFVFGNANDDSTVTFQSLLDNDGVFEKLQFDIRKQVAIIPYSSGTTGLPKGVELTHYNLIVNLQQLLVVEADLKKTGPHAYIGLLPFFHIYAMIVVLNLSILQGVKSVVLGKFELKDFLEIIQQHKLTYLHIVPPIVLALAKHPLVAQYDLSSVKVIFSGAAPLSKELEDEVRARLPNVVVKQAYGMTEASPAIFVSDTASVRAGSCGHLIPSMEARVLDTETNEELGVNKDGQIVVRGPNVMLGYLNNEEATKNTVIDGWLFTGDVGHIDDDGYWFIVDRVKELIKYKGFQVPPAELESLLLQHPAIADCAVIGRPDDEAGELPKAFVVLKPNQQVTGEEIEAWIGEQVAPHKKLRGGVEFIDAIPKSSSGKILRRLLKDKEKASMAK